MSFLSKAIQTFIPAIPAAVPAARRHSAELSQVLNEFRERRAEDLAQLADRAGRSGARLVEAEKERDRWRAYAHTLERLCLERGIPIPAAPDEVTCDAEG